MHIRELRLCRQSPCPSRAWHRQTSNPLGQFLRRRQRNTYLQWGPDLTNQQCTRQLKQQVADQEDAGHMGVLRRRELQFGVHACDFRIAQVCSTLTAISKCWKGDIPIQPGLTIDARKYTVARSGRIIKSSLNLSLRSFLRSSSASSGVRALLCWSDRSTDSRTTLFSILLR